MTGDIVRRDTDDWVPVAADVFHLADRLTGTGFVPKDLAQKPAAIAAAILTGRELGLGPMASLRGIHVVEGRAVLTAEMTAARILAAGHSIEWRESTDKVCEVRITRADGRSDATVRYTLADAQTAGLTGKKNWRTDPRSMLRWRALGNAARMVCPDVVMGLDVAADTQETPTAAPTGPVRVQVESVHPPAPEPATQPPATEQETGPVDMVTKPQLRKLNAMLTDLAKTTGQTWDKDQRRAVILEAAGGIQVDHATDLTKDQASAAIEQLDELLKSAHVASLNDKLQDQYPDIVDAEVVEEGPADG